MIFDFDFYHCHRTIILPSLWELMFERWNMCYMWVISYMSWLICAREFRLFVIFVLELENCDHHWSCLSKSDSILKRKLMLRQDRHWMFMILIGASDCALDHSSHSIIVSFGHDDSIDEILSILKSLPNIPNLETNISHKNSSSFLPYDNFVWGIIWWTLSFIVALW